MKTLMALLLLSSLCYAQPALTPEQQQKLQQDVEMLKSKMNNMDSNKASPEEEAQAKQMLETIQRGQVRQVEQQKALEELDAED